MFSQALNPKYQTCPLGIPTFFRPTQDAILEDPSNLTEKSSMPLNQCSKRLFSFHYPYFDCFDRNQISLWEGKLRDYHRDFEYAKSEW